MAHRTMNDDLRARSAPTLAALSVALLAGCYGAGMKPLPYDATAREDASDAAPEAAVDATADVRFVLEPRNVDAPLSERSPASFAAVELPMGASSPSTHTAPRLSSNASRATSPGCASLPRTRSPSSARGSPRRSSLTARSS